MANYAQGLCRNLPGSSEVTLKRKVRWQDLPYFLAVARTGSLTGAAKYIETNHATVGRHLQALEDALGAKLFERGPEGYVLTPRGDHFLGVVTGMQSMLRKALIDTSLFDVEVSGILRIGVPEDFGVCFLAERLAGFAAENKSLTLELLNVPPASSMAKPQGEINVTHARSIKGRFKTELLTHYRLYFYATQDYLDQNKPIDSPDKMQDHLIIGYTDDVVQASPQLDYSELHPGIRASLRYSSLVSQMEATCGGHGICVLPAYAASSRGNLVPILPEKLWIARSYYMSIHEDIAPMRRTRRFCSFLQEVVRSNHESFMADPILI